MRSTRGSLAAGFLLAVGIAVGLSGCTAEKAGQYTILDEGEGAMLCEVVRESYPPQCDGPFLVEWDWEAWNHQEESGVRWAEFHVRFVQEGDLVRVTEATPVQH